jgi:rsbT co-antagonist protein RsbR
MKNEAIKVFQKRKKIILETWINYQLADESLREDLISNEELRTQSDELLNILVNNLNDQNIDNITDAGFEPVIDILSSISISRARVFTA